MKFSEYQAEANKTAIYPKVGGFGWIYPALGLAGESGEVSEKIKKLVRDHNGILTNQYRQELSKELGDILWYIAQLATELELNLDDVASGNVKKLNARFNENKIHGNGDNR